MSTTYIATEDIYVARGVRAFSKGETVPESVVENLGVQDKVASDRPQATQAVVRVKDPAAKPTT